MTALRIAWHALRGHRLSYLYRPTHRAAPPLYERETWCVTCLWRLDA